MIITFETDKSDVMIHKNYDVKMSLMSKSPRVKLPIFVRSFIFMIQIFAKKIRKMNHSPKSIEILQTIDILEIQIEHNTF